MEANMKLLSIAIVLSMLSCAGAGPGMPERVGGLLGAKVEDGPCLETMVVFFFFKDTTTQEPAIAQTEKGCRCSYTINGMEYFPSKPFPQTMCEAYKLKKLKEENTSEQSGTPRADDGARSEEL
jgi:hypothetical protein